MEDFIFREAIPLKEDEEILSIYNCAHQRSLTMEWFKWYNYYCPNGENRLFIAEDREHSRIAAIWGMLPQKIGFENTLMNGSFASNATVHPDYQRKGLFTRLNKFVQGKELDRGVEVSIGIFGENDVWGMRRLGWELLGDLNFIACCDFDSRNLNANICKRENNFTKNLNPLLKQFQEGIKFGIVKDHKYINWRYFERPDQTYYVYEYIDHDEILGFVVLKCFEEGDYQKAHIIDICFTNEQVFDALINVSKIFSRDRNILNCWQPKQSPYLEWFYKCGFKPIRNKNILKSNLGIIRNLPTQSWWFMLGDYDVY